MKLSNYLSPTEEENKESNYLNLFLKIDDSQIDFILKSFSYYLSSNKNHKYNITHIIDQIPLFKKNVNIIKQKRKLYDEIKSDLIPLLKTKDKSCTVILDKCFLCSCDTEGDIKFVDNLSSFSINELSSETIYLQFIIESKILLDEVFNEEYSYLISYKDIDELLQKGANDVKMKIESALNI